MSGPSCCPHCGAESEAVAQETAAGTVNGDEAVFWIYEVHCPLGHCTLVPELAVVLDVIPQEGFI